MITCSIFGQSLSNLNSKRVSHRSKSIKSYPLLCETWLTTPTNCANFWGRVIISNNNPHTKRGLLSYIYGLEPPLYKEWDIFSTFVFFCLFVYLKGCVLSKSLPHELSIVKVPTAGNPRYGVYCGQLRIKKGMRFGPFTGSIVCPEKMATGSVRREFLWEVKYLRLLL